MPISKEELQSYLEEIGLSDEIRAKALDELTADQEKANKFAGQRLRFKDYTQKTQALAEDRKKVEQANEQLKEFAKELSTADEKVRKVMSDLETEKISRYTAEARLQRLKEQYQLSDEDIPKVTAPNPEDKKVPVGIDIDAKMEEFKTKLLGEISNKLLPELAGLSKMSAIQMEMRDEHKALTGKTLTKQELFDLHKLAGEQKVTLEQAWENKYGIPSLRTEKEFESRLAKEHQKWEEEQTRKASEDALAGVRRNREDKSPLLSSVLKHKFDQHADPYKPAPATEDKGGKPADKGGQELKLSGAERAAIKWQERRAKGIKLGKDDVAA